MDEAMNWLRNNEVKPGDVDVDVLRALTTISGVLMPKVNMSAAEKKKATDDAMSCWNNDPNLDDVDFATAQALGNLLV
jgi:hypothetical protein